jgi:uncharacterized LabA/DUF88 family protein
MEKRFAVFFDGDNISSKYYASIIAEILKFGQIIIKRVYGDWTTTTMNSWKEQVSKSPVKVVQQFRFGENATDGSIIMDIMELLKENKEIDSFCIVSSDSDYYGLALRLREAGKFVLGIGKKDAKSIWQEACDQYVQIENIIDFTSEKTDTENSDDILDINEILKYAFDNANVDNDNWISLSNFGMTIRARYPSFDPRTYNHVNLLSLLKASVNEENIKNNNSSYWVRKKIGESNDARKDGIIRVFKEGKYGFINNEKGDYYFTPVNIAKKSRNKEIKIHQKVSFLAIKEPDSTKTEGIEKNGKAIEIEIVE